MKKIENNQPTVLEGAISQERSQSSRLVKLSQTLENDGKWDDHESWIEDANKKGIVYASSADVMAVGHANKDKETIKIMQDDFKKRWLTTSTAVSNNGMGTFDAIHYFRSNVKNEISLNGLVIPAFRPISLNKLIENENILTYLKALANQINLTKSKAQHYVLKSLENLTGNEAKDIYIDTSQLLHTSQEDPSRGLELCSVTFSQHSKSTHWADADFHIYLNHSFRGGCGVARRVISK